MRVKKRFIAGLTALATAGAVVIVPQAQAAPDGSNVVINEVYGDGQGNNASVRNQQSEALLEHLGKQADWDDKPVFIVGDLNADESIAFEYSRRNYNVVDFHDASPFRSSDHDPIKVGFNLTVEQEQPEQPGSSSGSSSSSSR